MRQVVYSALRTPDGTVLESMHRHDYVTHTDTTNGKFYMLDGGTDYQRVSINGPCEWLTVFADEPFEKVREFATRGSRGKDGRQPLTWVKLKDMTNEHLEAVLTYGGEKWHLDLIRKELYYRKEHNIFIADGD